MSLYKKSLIYSAIISGSIVALMLIYFIFMLPSLYVDYVKRDNLESIKSIHKNYIKDGTYKDINSRNLFGTVTFKIPEEGDGIFISNKFGTIKANIKEENILKLLNTIRYYDTHKDEFKDQNKVKADFSEIKYQEILNKFSNGNNQITFENVENNSKGGTEFQQLASKVNIVDDNLVIYESNSTDGANYYTTYMAMSDDKGSIIISVLPVMTPKIGEIKPIIFKSLPMIIATSVLLILISTIFFSRKIVVPIEKLVNHAVFMKANTKNYVEPIEVQGNDEISVLAASLNELYSKLNDTFKELEDKNKYLFDLNKKQEVFLRASSHQLKTPVAAALLLVDGMINEIGRYKDTKTYIPKVKEQLLTMNKIINDILSINYNSENVVKDEVDIVNLIYEILELHEVEIKIKKINIEKNLQKLTLNSNREFIYKIVDNLINNAIKYTENEGSMEIKLCENKLSIINYGTQIESDLLPHIFEPFVSSNSEKKGHGLGLYIVSYYSKLLGFNVKIRNIENGVESIITF